MPVVQKGRGATNYAQRCMGIKLKEGSGDPSIDLIDLSVTNNGEWTASSGQAYKKVQKIKRDETLKFIVIYKVAKTYSRSSSSSSEV